MFKVILKSDIDIIHPRVFNVFDVCEKEKRYCEMVLMFLIFENNEWVYKRASNFVPEYCGRG